MNRLSKNKRNKKRKKIYLHRLLILLVLLALIIFVAYKTITILFNSNLISTFRNSQFTNSNIIKYTNETNGFTSTFSTSSKYSKIYKEFKQNQNTPWANEPYWGGTMSLNGCGITSIAIIASGYNINITPEDLRKQYYPHLETEDIYIALNDLGIKCEDFWFSTIYLNKRYILEWLETDRPILICVDNTKENKWTTASHYMVLLACNEDGLVYLSNPNGEDNTDTASGWYDINEILPYTAKALFIEDYI